MDLGGRWLTAGPGALRGRKRTFCTSHLQRFKPKSINRYHSIECMLLSIGAGRGVTFMSSSPLPGSLMGSDNSLSGHVGGGWWRQSDGREAAPAISSLLQHSKNKLSHVGSLWLCLGSPRLFLSLAMSVSAALRSWCTLLPRKHLSHWGPGYGDRMFLHSRGHRGTMELSPAAAISGARAPLASSNSWC